MASAALHCALTHCLLLSLAMAFSCACHGCCGQNHWVTSFLYLRSWKQLYWTKIGQSKLCVTSLKRECWHWIWQAESFRRLHVVVDIAEILCCNINVLTTQSLYLFLKQAVKSGDKINKYRCWAQICAGDANGQSTCHGGSGYSVLLLSMRLWIQFLAMVAVFQWSKMHEWLCIGPHERTPGGQN